MGAFGTGGFYSAPHPENIGSPGPEEQQQFQYDQTNPNPPQEQSGEPRKPRPIIPPYVRNWENSAASFAPDAGVTDPNMQPEIQQPANVGPSMGSLPLIAAGVFVLWLVFKGDQ
jgi:hypothetical protein